MRFLRGIHYPHPPRGPARKRYTVSRAALAQRHGNLDNARAASRVKVWRGPDESLLTKRLQRYGLHAYGAIALGLVG
ncbi:MAG TPA: hypothetical protein VGS59_06290 [Candidatus Acidoferrales bacterium]|nr:hypothetical protein [Candidatus Acidoferrales bacterium]